MTRQKDPNSLMCRIVVACAGPNGANSREIRAATGGSADSVGSVIPFLLDHGRLFRAGETKKYRYFATAADRDNWLGGPNPEYTAEQERLRLERLALRSKAKAAYAARRYVEQRAALGFTVLSKEERAKQFATTPRKATKEQVGRGRGIVIPKSEFKPSRPVKHVEAVNPNNVQPIICPPFVDRRFEVDPSIAGRGAISQDYYERRLKEQTR